MKKGLHFQTSHENITIKNLPGIFLVVFIFFLFFTEQVNAQNCTVNAGIDQTICFNSTMTLNGTYAGLPAAPSDANITWSQTSGPSVTITSPHSLTTTVTGFAANTTYSFKLSAKCQDGSLISNPVTVTVNPITIANAGPPQTLCPTPIIGTLAANAVGAGETGTWSVVNGSGINITDSHNPASTFTLAQNGSATVTLRWTIVGPAGSPQCISYSDVVITNSGGVIPVSAGANQTLNHCFSATTSTSLSASYAGNTSAGQSGYWTVISGPNIPAIANPNSNATGISNLVQGTYVLRWTVTGPCASGTSDMQIIVPAPTSNVTTADASASNQAFCDARTSFVLTGNNPQYTGETVLWTQTSSNPEYTVTITNPTSPITGVTISPAPVNASPVFTFSYTISNTTMTPPCTSSSNATVSYAIAPTLSIPNPIINLDCNVTTASITYNQTGSGGVEWSIISGATNTYYTSFPTSWVASNGSPQSIPNLTVIGTYDVRFRKVPATGTGCSTVTADATVTTSFSPTGANAGTDQLLACNVTSTALAGNDPTSTGVGQGTWTQVSGPNTAVISQINQYNSPVSNLIPGAYIFQWLISGGNNCPTDEDTVMVRVANQNPTTANAGLPQTVCYGTPVIMAANSPALNEIGTWSVIDGATSAVFSNIHNPHAVVTNLVANSNYTFEWTIVNSCSSSTSDVIITVNGTPGPVQANAGPDQCQGSGTHIITLSGNDPSPGSGFWRMLTGPNTPTITDPTIYNTTVTDMTDGTYSFEWATTLNNCAVSRDTMSVTISAPVTVANAGTGGSVCGTTLTLHGNVPVIGTGIWTQTSGNAGITIVSPGSNVTNVTGLIPGAYTFAWTISNGVCPSSTSEVQYNVSLPPSTAIAGPNQTLCAEDNTYMAATPPTSGTGLWSMVSGPNTPGFSSYSDPLAHVTGLITGTYDFKWTVSNGQACTPSTSDVLITVYSGANAGPDQSLCGVTTANLAGNVASIGTWTLISGATSAIITPTDPQSNVAIASNLLVGTYTFQYTLSYPDCSTSSVTHVTISGQPSTPNAGDDQELCAASSFSLSATPNPTPDGQTGLWTKLSGPSGGSFTNANLPATTFTGAQPGVYIFVWTLSQGGCSESDQVRITNYGAPSPSIAGPNQDVCGTWTTMAANTPTYGQGAWSEISGATDAIITSTILPNTTITNLSPGTYVFAWTISNPGCTSTTSNVTVYVHQVPTTANAGLPQELCNASGATLAGNPITIGTGLWTQLSGPDATIVTPTAYNSAVTFASLPGATSSVYVFTWTSTQPWVINQSGQCTTSSNVTITDDPPPVTAYAGPEQSICEYTPVVLAGNDPSPFTGTWTEISGATNASFVNPHLYNTAVNGTEVGSYEFQWTITSGVCSPSSSTVNVTINALPSTAIAGPNQVLCNGVTTATMAATQPTSGTGTWYQISGATNITFSDIHNINMPVSDLTATNAYGFEWVVANGSCTSSDYMTLFKDADIILTGPNDVTICSGGTPTLSVSASGGSGSYTYQWQSSTTSGGPFSNIPGANNQSYTTPPLTSDMYYQVVVECGGTTKCSATSGIAHVTVNADPSITVQPSGSTICSGTSWPLSVTAIGGTPELLYQWQYSTSGCSGYNNISGATDASYNTGVLTQSTYYRVRVSATGNSCGTVYSQCAPVYIPHITTQPTPTTNICNGGTASFTVAASSDGGTATFTYQWQAYNSGTSTWNDISGETNTTFTTPVLSTGTYSYHCVVTSATPTCTIISNNANVIVVNDPVIPTINDQSICTGGTATFTASPTGGVGPYFYQWQQGTGPCPGTDWASIPGQTNSSYTTSGGGPGSYYYNCIVTQAASGCSSTSNCVTLTVTTDPSLGQPPDQTICSGTSAHLSVTGSGGVPPLLYQWSTSSTCGGTYSAISGATSSTFDTPDLTVTTFYKVTVSSSGEGCNPATSSCITIHIPYITSQPVASTIICNGGTATLSVSAGSDGGTSSFTYQWQISTTSGSGYSDIYGATDASYTTDPLAVDHYYQVLVTPVNPSCSAIISSEAYVNVVADPNIPTIADQSICILGSASFIANPSGGVGPVYFYQWENASSCSGPFTPISGATSNIYTTAPGSQGDYYYHVVVTQAASGCTSTSNCIHLTVEPDITFSQPSDQTICSGTYATLSVSASGGVNPLLYQWLSASSCGGTFTNIPGATNSSYNTPSLTITSFYKVQVSSAGSGCNPNISSCITVYIPRITTQPTSSNPNICVGGSSVLTVATEVGNPPIGYTYEWQYNDGSTWADVTNGIPAGATYTNSATASLTVAGITTVATHNYRVVIQVTSPGCSDLTSNNVTVNVVADPTIDIQPTNPPDICTGGTTANMTIAAHGGTPSLNYQWQYYNGSWNNVVNNTPSGATYTGATSYDAFHVAGISGAGSYQYQCLVSATGSGCNTATSSTVTVTVVPDPTLTPPAFTNSSICVGGSTVVSSTISGGTGIPTYQWQYYNVSTWTNVTNGIPAGASYSGANILSMTISGTTATGTFQYRLTTNNSQGCDYNSVGNSYTVVADPNITTQPTSPPAICVGGTTANMVVAASGGTPSLNYQWQFYNGSSWVSVSDGTPIGAIYSGGTTNTFSVSGITSAGNYQYQCYITAAGDGCGTTTSNTVTVTVDLDPYITAQPVNPADICTGGTATMTISASGGTPSLNYQWQYYNGTSWNNVVNGTPTGASYSGSTSTSFSVTGISVPGSYQYQCYITASGNGCNPVTSNPATVTVVADPTIDIQPSDATICSGTSTTLTVTAHGGTPSLNYLWQYFNGSIWVTAPGTATNPTYVTQALTSSTQFRVQLSASGSGCDPITSSTATVYIPHITTQPATSTTICDGGTITLTTAVSSDGGTATFTYQWQASSMDCSFGYFNIPGATNPTYTSPALSAGVRYYQCVITSANPTCTLTTNCATVNILADPTITTQPSGGTICRNSTYTMNVVASGGTGTLTYQWQSNTSSCGSSFTIIPGATNSSYTTGALTSTTYFNVIVNQSGSGCNQMTSNCATVTVTQPATSVAGSNASICAGTTYTLSGSATNYTSVYWTTNGTGYFNNADVLGPTYTPSAADITAGSVTLTLHSVAASPCPEVTSSMILTITSGISITTQPVGTIICSGGNYTLNIVASSGTSGTLSYQWQSNTTDCNSSFTNITGATTNTYAASSLALTTYYRVIVSESGSGCGSVISDCATVTVNAGPTIITQPSGGTICTGSTYTMSVVAGGGTGTLSYRWQSNTSGCSGYSDISNATNSSYTTPALSQTNYYRVVVSQTGNGCGPLYSNCATVTVNATPVVYAGPNASICSGNTYTLSGATATLGTYSSLLWTTSGDGFFNNNTTLNPVYTPGIADITSHTVTLTLTGNGNAPCGSASSNMILSITSGISITTQPVGTIICSGGNYTLNIVASSGTSGTLSYQWQSNTTDCNSSFTNITGATTNTYAASSLALTTYYRVIVSESGSGCGSVISDCATVTVNAGPTIITQPSGGTICTGSTYTMSVVAGGGTGTLSYRWQSNTSGCSGYSDISNATNSSYTTPALSQTTYYRVVVSQTGNGCGPVYSNCATVTVNPNPTAVAGGPATICSGQTYQLSGSATNYSSVAWTTSGDGYFNNATSLTPIYTPGSADILAGNAHLTLIVKGNSPCGSASDMMILTITQAINITAEPMGTTICSGGTYPMSVTASGGGGTYNYQWESNTTDCFSSFTPISGATNASYTATALTTTTYYKVIVNQNGSSCSPVTSNCATVTVTQPPTAYAGVNGATCQETAYTLSGTSATNYSSLSWSVTPPSAGTFTAGNTLTPTFTPASGVTGNVTLTLTANGNSPCPSTTSTMTLNIQAKPTAYAGPDGTMCQGKPYTVSGATATNYASYLWTSTGLGVLTGANTLSPTYTPATGEVGLVTLTLTVTGNAPCGSVSDQMVIDFKPSATITTQPSGGTICSGSTFTMNVAATGGASTLSYQWQSNTTSCTASFQPISGATNATYTTDVLTTTTYYRAVVTQTGYTCDNLTSDCATVNVTQPATAYAGTTPVTICSGSTYGLVDASAGSYTSVYWTTSGTGSFNNPNTVNPVYTPSAYDVIHSPVTLTLHAVAASPCPEVTSSMTLNILPSLSITTQPLSGVVCSDNNYPMSVVAEGGSGSGFTYQWESNTTDCFSSFTPISGATNASYTATALTTTTYYKVIVNQNGSSCNPVTSNCATVTVTQPPTAYAGVNGATCQETAYTLSGTSATNYSSLSWSVTPPSAGTFTAGNTLTPTFTPASGVTGNVTLTLTANGNSPCPSTTSTMTLNIQAKPTAYAGPDGTMCQGKPYTVSGATATNYASYLWTSTGLGVLTGATTLSPTYTPATGEVGLVTLTLTVTGNAPCGSVSDQMVIDFKPSATITTQPSGGTICSGSTFTMNVAATGGASTLSYQWQSNTTSCTASFQPISGATNATYTTDVLTTTTYYNVVVTQTGYTCDNLTSDCATVNVTQPATAYAGTTPVTICSGSTYGLVDASAGSYTSVYWTTSGTGSFNNPNTVNPVYTPSAYDVIHSPVTLTLHAVAASPCPEVTSSMTLNILPSLSITTQPLSGVVCSDNNYPMSVVAEGGSGSGFTYQWESNTTDCFSSFTPISGATNASYTATALTTTTYYKVIVNQNGSSCSPVTSNCATVTVTQPPTAYAGVNGTTCQETAYTLSGTSATNYSSLSWSVTPPSAGTFTAGNTLTPTFTPASGVTGNVTLTLTANGNSPCPSTTSTMTLNIQAKPTAYAGPDGTMCQGKPYTVSGATATNYASYLWTSTGLGVLTGATTLSPTYTPATGEVGLVTLTLTVTGNAPCGSVSDQMVIDFKPSATITTQPSGGTICSGSTFTMNVAATGGASTLSYQWQSNTTSCTASFQPISGATNATYTTDVLTTTTYYNVVVTQTGYTCDNLTSDCATVNVVLPPVANAGPDQQLCNQYQTFLTGNFPPEGGTVAWTQDSGPPGAIISPANSPMATVTGLIASVTPYVFRYTVTANYPNSSCSGSDVMTVVNYHYPSTPYAGPDQHLCITSGTTASTTLTGNNPVYGNGIWRQMSGPNTAVIANPANYTTGVSNLAQGSYVFSWGITNGVCDTVKDYVEVDLHLAPTANAGVTSALICAGTSYGLVDATVANNQSVYWTTGGDGTFNNPTTLHPDYTPGPLDITNHSVILTLHATGFLPCAEATSSMTLNIQQGPVANAGPDATICETSTYCLCTASASNYTTISWESIRSIGPPVVHGDGTFSNPGSVNPVYTPGPEDIAAGCIYLVMHLGANPPCTSVTDTMKLCISRVPVAYAGADAMICEGFTYTISDATASHYTGLTWTTSGTGTFSDIHAVNPVYTPSNADILAGSVTLTMNLTACSPCPNVSDAMNLTIHRNPTATAYVVSNVSCFGLSDGVVSVSVSGGTTPYSYLWSTTATTQTVSGLSIGTYYVTVSDNFGCRNYSQTTVGQPPLLTVSGTVAQNVRCKGGSEGQITITPDGGTPGYSYLWSNNATSQNISGLTAGTYSVTVTDSHTCTATGSWTVTEPDLLTVSGNVTHDVVCKGGSEGSITITAGGGTTSYTYFWSNTATSQNISGLTAGTYTVTVTDNHSCTVSGSWTVTEPDLLTVDGMVTHHVLCHGGNDGTISITTGGGTEAYSYMWSNSATTQNISALTAGTYIVTVTDAHSCTVSGSWTVTQPEALSISGVVTNVSCYSYSTGAIEVTYGGGVTPYHYNWSNSATSGSLSGLPAGTYTVTVTDAHSCTLSDSWTVTQPPVWKVLITGPDAACCNSAITASYHASTTGAVPQCSNNQDPTFQWIVTGGTITSGWNTPTITVNWSCCGTGIVSVAATACNGCIRDTSASITIHPQPAPVISGPVTVPSDTTALYCTPNFNGHLYTWTVFGGSVVGGNGTNCVSIHWGPYPPCGCGSVTVCETDPTTQCTGCTTMNITILPAHPNLDGYVYYQNGYNTGLNGVIVHLKNLATGITVATDTSGPNLHSSNAPGYFAFTGLDAGTYQLEASYDGTWGGNNATDALLVQLDVIGSITLTGLPLAVADVNASNTITGLDALYIKLRTVGMIDSYPAGDWMFDNPTVTVTPVPLLQNIMGLCVGDVNGSYIPNGMKDAPALSIIDDGIQTIPFLDSFTYTIRSSQAAELGAMTLFMGYDQNLFKIDKVNTSLDGMKYVIGEGKIALAWSDTKSLQVKYADPILTLTMSSRVTVPDATRIFSIMPGSEFADIKASKLDNFDLRMAEVVNPHSSFSMFTYPNPFNDFANVVYTLPESGHVKLIITDMFGKIIRSLADANQDAGIYQVTIHPDELNMTPGMYFCKIEVAGKTDSFKKVDKLIFQH